MIVLALLLAGPPVQWRSWSASTFDAARKDDHLVFCWVGALDEPPPSGPELTAVLQDRFVALSVDGDERPGVRDFGRLALATLAEAATPIPVKPFWLVLTPGGRPFAGGVALEPSAIAGTLERLAEGYRLRRTEAEARAGIALSRIALSQVPAPSKGMPAPSVLGRALAEARARKGREPAVAGLRVLRAWYRASPTPESRQALESALASLAEGPTGSRPLAEEAQRLRDLASGEVEARPVAVARAIAQGLLDGPRDDRGAFLHGAHDDRAFAYENGLAIGALALSSLALDRPGDATEAGRAVEDVLARLGPWPILSRCAGAARRCGPAYLEDYAFLAEGLLDLHAVSGQTRFRDEAEHAVNAALARFLDARTGSLYDTDASHAPLPVRLRTVRDGDRPAASGVLCAVLSRLAQATGMGSYEALARQLVASSSGDLERDPAGAAALSAAAIDIAGLPDTVDGDTALLPARATVGPAIVEGSVSSSRARPGAAVEGRLHLTVAAGWTVSGHQPAPGLVPLTVSAATPLFRSGPARYPPGDALVGEALVTLPLRVDEGAPAGEAPLRLSVRLQACRPQGCEPPRSVLLDVPFVVGAPEP
ncbi:MAG TPA: DUF255 domain-containing protein [Vicinamibacteria bacterium]